MIRNNEIQINHQYFNFPVKEGAPMRKVRFRVDNQVVRFFEIEWAEGEPDFWVFTDVSAFKGEWLVIEIDEAGKKHPSDVETSSIGDSEILEALIHSDTIEGGENLYQEKYRPQFHFTSRRGWNNDPNGLVYYKGTYHLFYQHNPYGLKWGNMHWGHAISKNLVQWHEDSDVLYPDQLGTMFSGCAFVDWDNTAGLRNGLNDTLICFYTAAGEYVEPKVPFTQCMAYSVDGGQSWRKYDNNPIFPHIAESTRDPCVIWDPDSKQWIMALYIGYDHNREQNHQHYALYASTDLNEWDRLQDFNFPGRGECPDFFPIHLDGDVTISKWVFWTADGYYLVGTFDGNSFEPETEILKSTYGPNKEFRCGYAAQTWRDIPQEDGRRIQIAWLINEIPEMPFNQQMTFPVELTLKSTENGPRLHSWPIKEIELLYQKVRNLKNIHFSDQTILPTDGHDLLDIETVIEVGDADEIELNLRGIPLIYNVNKQEISFLKRTTQLKTKNGNIQMRVLLDRTSVEIYAADGLIYIPYGVIPEDHNTVCFLQARGGASLAKTINIIKLVSSWE
jgi:fructan beta-fructosidase